jgi:NAD dependent epimerase/dehydratase
MSTVDYRNLRVLVTGAAGFIGSHLVEELLVRGAQVRALYQYNSRNNRGWLAAIDGEERLEPIFGDIRDAHQCDEMVEDIDVIFHLAALIGIPYSYLAPASYIATNVNGTLNIANAWRNTPDSPIMVQMSTSEVYGSAIYTPMDEGHALQPQSPYSASKIGADALVKSFSLTYEVPSITVRPFNNYGPRQSSRAIIPTIISQALLGEKEIELGNTAAIRDFVYVKDTCRIIADLARSPGAIGETINIGTGQSVTITKLCDVIGTVMGIKLSPRSVRSRKRPKRSEVDRLECDNSKLRALIEDSNFTTLVKGIEATVEWFANQGVRHSARDYHV